MDTGVQSRENLVEEERKKKRKKKSIIEIKVNLVRVKESN